MKESDVGSIDLSDGCLQKLPDVEAGGRRVCNRRS